MKEILLTEKMIENGLSNTDIRKITGLSLSRIEQIRKRGEEEVALVRVC